MRRIGIPWGLAAAGLVLAVVVAAAQQTAQPVIPSTVVKSTELLRDLQVLSADDMQGRRMGTPGGLKAQAYVESRFKAVGLAPIGQTFLRPFVAPTMTGLGAIHGANVVGRIDGTVRPERYLVVSAHYDHVGMRNGQIFNGADDNASGTAALFAIASHFRRHPPANSLLIVAFDGEEAGLAGSRAFVKASPVDRAAIRLNVNADMIGRDDSDTLWVTGTRQQPFLKPFVQRVAARAPIRLVMGHDDPTRPGEDDWTADSDQYAFLEAGIPALYVGVSDERYHHRASDDFETMTLPFYVRAVETVIRLVEEFDRGIDAVAAAGAAR